jgi:hypothetical protein
MLCQLSKKLISKVTFCEGEFKGGGADCVQEPAAGAHQGAEVIWSRELSSQVGR